jgi:hypothetical protein
VSGYACEVVEPGLQIHDHAVSAGGVHAVEQVDGAALLEGSQQRVQPGQFILTRTLAAV